MHILTQLVLLLTFTFNGNFITILNGYKPGDKASDFSLKSVDGKTYSLSNYKDAKGFIIVFTCNSCPFAVMYEDRINDLAKKYRSQGYVLLAINPNDPSVKPDDSYEMMQQRTKEKGFVFPYLFDEGQKVYPVFGATKTPHVFLLDRSHVVKYVGAIDNNAEDAAQVSEKYLENAIAALEKGLDPNPASTKAIGCSIKVRK
ncbi:MAG: thioredoxin family protein [Saprospiraceae bacterium]|nr:thioredoxin family protein [Saprospiraceae bacterium]